MCIQLSIIRPCTLPTYLVSETMDDANVSLTCDLRALVAKAI